MIDMQNINKIIAETFAIEEQEFDDQLGPGSIENWDSLAHLRLITAIEAEYSIQLSMDDVQIIDSIGKLKEIIAKYQ